MPELLGISDGVDGAWPDHGDLSGPLQQVSAGSRHQGHQRLTRLGFLGDGECDEPETLGAITLASREKPRQSDLRHQLQPAAARRPGPRQRQNHPGIGRHLPRGRLERHQGHLGRRLGPAPGPRRDRPVSAADGRSRRRRISEVHRHARQLHPRALLRQISRAGGDGRPPLGREAAASLRRGGHDPEKVYAAYKAAVETKGKPTVILAKTIKGYGLGEGRRRAQRHSPAEEAQRRRAPRVPHPLRHSDLRRGRGPGPVLSPAR